jgi:hypothetical protein
MIKTLVGYSGFVGSNLNSQAKFDYLYNSKNIVDSYGTSPDLLIYSGLRAEKFLANQAPEKDYDNILEAIENVKKINPKMIVLISTIDVYKKPIAVNEDSAIETKGLHPYGLNRLKFEQWVESNFSEHLIVHLPGLYGKNIKKNFIYDLMNLIPSMLSENKFLELSKKNSSIKKHYLMQDNGFYKCKELNEIERKELKNYFSKSTFNALNFTDSRGIFQFYNLAYLWKHINIALKNNIKKLNLATEPVSTSELYKYIKNSDFDNKITENPPHYNFKTKHFELFEGNNGFIFDKNFVLADIKKFIEESEK